MNAKEAIELWYGCDTIEALSQHQIADMLNGLVCRVEELESAQSRVQADKCCTGLPHVFKWDGTLNTPEMLECENCGIRR